MIPATPVGGVWSETRTDGGPSTCFDPVQSDLLLRCLRGADVSSFFVGNLVEVEGMEGLGGE